MNAISTVRYKKTVFQFILTVLMVKLIIILYLQRQCYLLSADGSLRNMLFFFLIWAI